MPDTIVNPSSEPIVAHKESLIEMETATDIVEYIDTVSFSQKTRHDLKLLVASASGREFRTANFNKWEAMEKMAGFRLRAIESEVLVPREDRDRREYEAVRLAIEDLFFDNLSQSTRDEAGRNVFYHQYVDETHASQFSESREQATVTNISPQQGGVSLSRMPIVGGFFK
jgi:hypothetical protein